MRSLILKTFLYWVGLVTSPKTKGRINQPLNYVGGGSTLLTLLIYHTDLHNSIALLTDTAGPHNCKNIEKDDIAAMQSADTDTEYINFVLILV